MKGFREGVVELDYFIDDVLAALEELVDLSFEYFEVEDGVDEETESSGLFCVEGFEELLEVFKDGVELLDDRP